MDGLLPQHTYPPRPATGLRPGGGYPETEYEAALKVDKGRSNIAYAYKI